MSREIRIREQRAKDQMSPVKFATLVFFEEFNGASRGRRAEVRSQKSEVREQKSEVRGWTKDEG